MSDSILLELINSQRIDINIEKKLLYNDLIRISKHLNNSIFKNDNINNNINNNECSLWNGHIVNINNKKYINFYLNNKKHSLHRILYYNYVEDIKDNEYIKFKCINKGLCCNINHYYKKNNNNKKVLKNSINNSENIDLSKKNNIIINF